MTNSLPGRPDQASDHALVRLRSRSIIVLGIALILCGMLAVASPAISTMAVTLFLGLLMAAAGTMKIVQAFTMQRWSGFLWQLVIGLIELGGGILVYFNPMKGAIAITFVIALVLIAEGIAQLGLAFRLRRFPGAGWMAFAGLVSAAVGIALALRLPYDSAYTPGTLVGISLIFAGWSYIAIAMAARRAGV